MAIRLGRRAYHRNQEENLGIVLVLVLLVLLQPAPTSWSQRFHLRPAQLVEGGLYLLFLSVGCISIAWYVITLPRRRETAGLTLLYIYRPNETERQSSLLTTQNAIVLGYDVHGKPWLWPDATRVMQSVGIRGHRFGQDNTAQEHHYPGPASHGWSGK